MEIALDKINLTPQTPEEVAATIGQLLKIIIALKKENDWLREQLNNNSNNSSLPPSRDFKKKKKVILKSGRKRSGQVGHKGQRRNLISPKEVDAKEPNFS